jgi:transposase
MEKFEKMKIVNPNAAGIDVGSKSHFVAIGQEEKDVCEFGVYSKDHLVLIDYLKRSLISSIAMESTGSYWQTLFFALQEAGFEVLLVCGYQTKNLRAKTDVKDCQWIQKLHSLGLLRGSFLPSEQTARIRILHRHRSSLLEESSKMTNKMQKALRLMNLRLDVVISDITGKSGIAIIAAILNGERNGENLARLADPRVRKSREEISNALQGHWSEEYLFELKDCFDIYKLLQEKIKVCDLQIEKLLLEFTKGKTSKVGTGSLTKKQLKGKNQPKIDLVKLSNLYYDVDLFAIEGVSVGTVLTLISEIGQDIYKFQSAKQFSSFLRLAPNNRISGGKIISSRTPKGANRFSIALRNAANTIENVKKGPLFNFFKRIAYKKGRGAAITATARKLSVIIWNMIVKKQEYQPIETELYNQMIKQKRITSIRKMMKNSNILINELSTNYAFS